MSLMRRASLVLPFALPIFVLVVWFSGRSGGQVTEPLHIMASIDPDGGRTTSFSTILTDGNEAIWTCSAGTFLESGVSQASGRSVTWQPHSDLADSVTVIITTPSVTDTVIFLSAIPDLTPVLTVSAAYHLALLERARTIQLPPGNYSVAAAGEGLRNYDGLTVLIIERPELPRNALGLLPGDTLEVSLPLGGVVTATGLDTMEGALDNSGTVHVTFELIVSGDAAEPEPPAEEQAIPAEDSDESSEESSSL